MPQMMIKYKIWIETYLCIYVYIYIYMLWSWNDSCLGYAEILTRPPWPTFMTRQSCERGSAWNSRTPGVQWCFTGWWFGTWLLFSPFSLGWFSPIWRTHIFQGGRAQPPISLCCVERLHLEVSIYLLALQPSINRTAQWIWYTLWYFNIAIENGQL